MDNMDKKKCIPFRYKEDLEKDFEELFKLQGYTRKKNLALNHAVKIAAGYLRKIKKKNKKGESSGYDALENINDDLIIKLNYWSY